MKYICKSCGAEIDDTMPKCPYCDTLIVKGAQKAYMDKLYDIREDMEDLKELPYDVVREEVRHQGKRIKTIIIATVVIVVLFAAYIVWQNQLYERDHTADYIWEQENFPIMTEMYENGEYDVLESYFYDAMMDDKSVWNWDYYDEFMEWMEEQE